jgi:predicted RNase H-like nuclease
LALTAVLGVDGCPGGWVGVVLDGDASKAATAATLAELVALVDPVACVAVDIPIGLPDTGRRQADTLVRRVLGRRGTTVFDAAVRDAYEAATHAEGSALHRERTGRGLSVQAWHLGPRVLDAGAFARSGSHLVLEVHPELSFASMAGTDLPPKKTPEGAAARRELLEAQGISVPALPRPARADDVLDACAVAWTARRYLDGQASSYPAEPELFSDGIPAAIWV